MKVKYSRAKTLYLNKISVFLLILFISTAGIKAQNSSDLFMVNETLTFHPLQDVVVGAAKDGIISVKDGNGAEYFKGKSAPQVQFKAGGAVGTHTITLFDKRNKIVASMNFELEAKSELNDGGKFTELFNICYNGMLVDKSENGEIKWKGTSYKFFVPWDLDNSNVMNGIQYFSPHGDGLTDLLRETQRKDGMIWSFVRSNHNDYHYYETAYDWIGFFKKDEDAWFVRQPVDNHSDYCYVNMFYKHWKASGNNDWMKKTLPSAALALDYGYNDSIRWSDRFQLLKRPYCIDSWDFQVDDEYTPEAPVSSTMVLVPGKTKYGVFFGDNTGYFEACNQVAEMYDYIGLNDRANLYRERGKLIMENLMKLSWNGNFFTHFIDEDSSVIRNLGVDERAQIAQSNMYSLNRGLPHDVNVSIIKTYQNLKENLPEGSPGEWYSIYPPFEKGFGGHNEKWQYMNGGVAGHAIGELARGAYENGYENYASDILNRLYLLGKKYNDKIYFSYTGAIFSAPAPPTFQSVSIEKQANMDLWGQGSTNAFTWMNTPPKSGNDMRGLPVGNQMFQNIPFTIVDPDKNNRRSAIAVSKNSVFPGIMEVPVNKKAGAIYLLHSSSDNGTSKIAGGITFIYNDGSEVSKYLLNGQDVTNWWFPALMNERSGVAWSGPNLISTQVGVCWTAIDNPHPDKNINKILFTAPLESGIYTVLAISLADKPHYVPLQGESFGGPDNWAAANGMAALMEGLAGVKNTALAYAQVTISPRWPSADVDSVSLTAHFPASDGYVSYQYKNDRNSKEISLLLTGSGKEINAHILLPENSESVQLVTVNNQPKDFTITKIESSKYVDFTISSNEVKSVLIKYQ